MSEGKSRQNPQIPPKNPAWPKTPVIPLFPFRQTCLPHKQKIWQQVPELCVCVCLNINLMCVWNQQKPAVTEKDGAHTSSGSVNPVCWSFSSAERWTCWPLFFFCRYCFFFFSSRRNSERTRNNFLLCSVSTHSHLLCSACWECQRRSEWLPSSVSRRLGFQSLHQRPPPFKHTYTHTHTSPPLPPSLCPTCGFHWRAQSSGAQHLCCLSLLCRVMWSPLRGNERRYNPPRKKTTEHPPTKHFDLPRLAQNCRRKNKAKGCLLSLWKEQFFTKVKVSTSQCKTLQRWKKNWDLLSKIRNKYSVTSKSSESKISKIQK